MTTPGTASPQLEIAHVLYMDIVSYSRLPMEEQSRRIGQLQDLVRETAEFRRADSQHELLCLPTGDGMALVFFRDPAAPVRCAVEVARRLRRLPELPLRLGVHSGPVYRIEDINTNMNVAGGGINMAQRVMDCGDAGHILLSDTVAEFLGQLSEWSSALHDLGECSVKHGVRVHLFNLFTEEFGNQELPDKVRVQQARLLTGNLSRHLAPPPFIGREEVVGEVITALNRRPVVTLLGPGGMGKTRLATEVGARVAGEFPAGVWVIPLEAVRRGDAVATEIMAVLGLKANEQNPEDALLQHLHEWHGLLILDNLEQLVEEKGEAFTGLARTIARQCPSTRLICTSRIDLHLGSRMEAKIVLPPLPAPGPRSSMAELRNSPSVQLCVEQLKQRVRHFALNEASAAHVAAICRATEGIPLLIELAAGQLGRRTLPQIARDVERALTDTDELDDRPDRHRDLGRLLDWSLALLEEERPFFLRLGVFRGSFDAAAAAAVADEPRAEEFLQELVDAHLVASTASDDYLAESLRYRLLAATAAYCRSSLGEALFHWRCRHAAHYGKIAQAAGRRLAGTPRDRYRGDPSALEELARERDNLTAALETALDSGDLELAATIGEPAWELLHRMGLWPIVREDASRLRDQARSRLPEARRPLATAAMALAQAAHDEGLPKASRGYYEEALSLWQEMGEEDAAARALHGLGNALRRLNELEAAEPAYRESLALATRLGDDPLRALNLTALGLVASGAKRLEEADDRLKEAVALFRSGGNPWGLAIALNSRAQNLERLGQLRRARELYQESLEIKRELEDRRGIAITLAALGRLAPALNEPETARALLAESLSVNRELGDAWGIAVTLGALADRWLADGEAEPALEAAAAAHEALKGLGGGSSRDAAESGRVIETARSRLSPDQADMIEARGRERALTEACDAALSREPAPPQRDT